MFDDLRDLSDDPEPVDEVVDKAFAYEPPRPESRFLGMTSGQRLLISILLLATVIVMGTMCLLVTERLWFF
jgi:hypothetical protein